jgi:hypothetical protein
MIKDAGLKKLRFFIGRRCHKAMQLFCSVKEAATVFLSNGCSVNTLLTTAGGQAASNGLMCTFYSQIAVFVDDNGAAGGILKCLYVVQVVSLFKSVSLLVFYNVLVFCFLNMLD